MLQMFQKQSSKTGVALAEQRDRNMNSTVLCFDFMMESLPQLAMRTQATLETEDLEVNS